MEIEDCISGSDIFLFDEEGADIFTLVVGDMEIDPFEGLTLEDFFLGEDRAYVVGVLDRGDDSSPGPLEVFSQGFHNKK